MEEKENEPVKYVDVGTQVNLDEEELQERGDRIKLENVRKLVFGGGFLKGYGLLGCAKYLLENNFSNVSVIGEISNLAKPSSGHIYFTLKDADGAIRCAMFKNQNIKLNFSPEDGDQCVLKGQVSIYAPRGDYQLIVKTIEPAGAGNLMQKFEVLKNKLEQEGLFNIDKKKEIPSSPKHIGIITSSTTAAFQDIISTVNRRAPNSQISLSEATVQGDEAHISIINALNRIIRFNKENSENEIDVVILSRGGGSIEDLWCFNNEELAREIFSFPIPTISGVGHEIDFTICDFVSDMSCLLYTSPSPRDQRGSRMPASW